MYRLSHQLMLEDVQIRSDQWIHFFDFIAAD